MANLDFIGSSPKFRAVLDKVNMVAPVDCAVLIQGETGTGKDAIARAIHEASPRRQHRFVAVNCAAIPATLLESELFGHERGAFTGAVTLRLGRFQIADRGTLFLDEIGELPLELQPKLLRVIQEQEFERLGSSQTTRVDVRIVAATNQNIEQMVSDRRFRLDLYYRLNVFPITLPPLRERTGDIGLLVTHFLRTYAQRQGESIECVPDDVMTALERYSWPGNIRELQNAIEHAAIMGSSEWLKPEDLPETVLEAADPADLASPYHAALGEARRDCVIRAWNEADGDHDGAARILGMHPNSLRRLIRHLGLKETLAVKGITPRA